MLIIWSLTTGIWQLEGLKKNQHKGEFQLIPQNTRENQGTESGGRTFVNLPDKGCIPRPSNQISNHYGTVVFLSSILYSPEI